MIPKRLIVKLILLNFYKLKLKWKKKKNGKVFESENV
jgi:hypothetical protein